MDVINFYWLYIIEFMNYMKIKKKVFEFSIWDKFDLRYFYLLVN